jgi:phosphatidylglycerophosphate synthase
VVLTGAAGLCYSLGARSRLAWRLSAPSEANAYLLLAGGLLVLACLCDALDGAVARLGNQRSRFGAFLDSTVDRFSDFAVFGGIAAAYALARPANATFVLLSMLAFFNAFMISYTRARAEDLIESCTVGFWQRGERMAAILIATFAYNIPALVLQQATLAMTTVIRRIRHTKAVIEGRDPHADPRQGGLAMKIRFWRWPRKTLPYDLTCAVNVAWLIFARIEPTDWLAEMIA